MKARRKSDGEIIGVEAIVYNRKNGERYSPSELDFNVDAEDTVIQGWVCRDKKDSALNLHAEKPYRTQSGYDVGDEPDWWESDCASFLPLDKNLFPDLTWDDPQEVEIIIKRKKK